MDEVKRVKIVVTDTTRKLSVRKGQVISDICKILDNREPHFVYTDEDGDRITAFSDQEMEDAIFKDNITKFEWKGTSGASAGGDFGPQHPSKSQDSSAASPAASKVRKTSSEDSYYDVEEYPEQQQNVSEDADLTLEEARKEQENSSKKPKATGNKASTLTDSSVSQIKQSLSDFHKEQFGSPIELDYKKEGGKSFLTCSLCETSLDITINWRNVKSHFNNASHKTNFYSVYGRECSEAVSSCVELSEIQAKRFISSEAPEEGLKIELKDGKPIIICTFCNKKSFFLSGRPSCKVRVREHLMTQKHIDGKNSQGGKKFAQTSIFQFSSSSRVAKSFSSHK